MSVILILIFMCLSALFSGMETTFSSVNHIRLKYMADQGNKKAKTALSIAENYDKALTAILIGNNIVNIGSSALATVLFTRWIGTGGAAVSTVVMTILVLTFCEVLPKSYAKSHAEKMALAVAGVLSKFMLIMTPFVWLFQKLSKVLQRDDKTPSVTEDELQYLMDEMEEEGVLEEQESDLVQSALRLDDRKVSQILLPRVQLTAIEKDASIEEIQEKILSCPYSRFPVYEKDLDHIFGMITSKDFFRLICGKFQSISEIILPVLYIPESKRLSNALREMQQAKTHLAVVVDQHGGTEGIVTLEDILEELVGEIYDESDEVIENVQKIAPHIYHVLGICNLIDFYNGLDEEDRPDHLPENIETVSGLVCGQLGSIPTGGEVVEVDTFRFTVQEVENQCVKCVQLEIIPPTV